MEGKKVESVACLGKGSELEEVRRLLNDRGVSAIDRGYSGQYFQGAGAPNPDLLLAPEIKSLVELGQPTLADAFVVVWDRVDLEMTGNPSLETFIEVLLLIWFNFIHWIPNGSPKRVAILASESERVDTWRIVAVLRGQNGFGGVEGQFCITRVPAEAVDWVLNGKYP